MRKKAHGFALFAATLMGAGAAVGQDLESLLEDPVVKTGSSAQGSSSLSPAQVTTITREDLRRFGLRSLDEAINYLASGMMIVPNLHSVEIGARGVVLHGDYGNHVLLMVNGLTLNESWNGTAYFERGAGIPLDLVDRIEIMVGPGSVIYGSQAMLGVINVVTRDGADYRGYHVEADGELIPPIGPSGVLRSPGSDGFVSDLGGSYRLAGGYGREFELFGETTRFALGLEYFRLSGAAVESERQTGIVDSSTGELKNFGPGQEPGVWGGKAKQSWYTEAPAGYLQLKWDTLTLSSRAGAFLRSAPYMDWSRYLGDFDRDDDYEKDSFLDLELKHEADLSAALKLNSRVFYNYNRYEWHVQSSAAEDCDEGQVSGCENDLYGIGQRVGFESIAGFLWNDSMHQRTMLGLTGQLRDVDSATVLRAPQFDSDPIGVTDLVDVAGAIFAEHTLRPTDFLDLNLGARLDGDERGGGHLSPRAAALVSVWDGGTVKGIFSEAFRAPSAYELTYEDGFGQIRNPFLRPEVVRTVELGFEQWLGSHRFSFQLFRSYFSDLVLLPTLDEEQTEEAIAQGLVTRTDDELFQYRNASSLENWGHTTGYRGLFLDRKLELGGSVTVAQSTVFEEGAPPQGVTITPHWFGNARASYSFGEKLPTLGLVLYFRGHTLADRFFDGGFTRPPVAPGSIDLRSTLSGPVPGIPVIAYRLSVHYGTSGEGPYTIGPVQYAGTPDDRAALIPQRRLDAFAGLRVDLP